MTDEFLALTGEIVVAHVSHNAVAPADMPDLIRSTYAAIARLGEPVAAPAPLPKVRKRAAVKAAPTVRPKKTPALAADTETETPAPAPTPTPTPAPAPTVVMEAPPEEKPARRRLGLVLPKAAAAVAPVMTPDVAREATDVDLAGLLTRAIRSRSCVRWTYNRTAMLVAPYILYTDREALYVDGVAREKNGVPPREIKVGRFKLSGLSDVTATGIAFTLADAPDASDARYAQGIVASAAPGRRSAG